MEQGPTPDKHFKGCPTPANSPGPLHRCRTCEARILLIRERSPETRTPSFRDRRAFVALDAGPRLLGRPPRRIALSRGPANLAAGRAPRFSSGGSAVGARSAARWPAEVVATRSASAREAGRRIAAPRPRAATALLLRRAPSPAHLGAFAILSRWGGVGAAQPAEERVEPGHQRGYCARFRVLWVGRRGDAAEKLEPWPPGAQSAVSAMSPRSRGSA